MKKITKKFVTLTSLALTLAMMLNLTAIGASASSLPEYAVTENTVIIDHTPYPIVNNTVQYDGYTFQLEDYSLVRYEEDGTRVCFLLPVEQNKVTDSSEIARLNASVGVGAVGRAVPSNPLSTPPSGSVAQGNSHFITPAFNNCYPTFYYYTSLKLFNFPLISDRRFQIIFYVCNSTGTWFHETVTQDFLYRNTVRFINASSNTYGQFHITNLYGNPSPAYKYEVKRTQS